MKRLFFMFVMAVVSVGCDPDWNGHKLLINPNFPDEGYYECVMTDGDTTIEDIYVEVKQDSASGEYSLLIHDNTDTITSINGIEGNYADNVLTLSLEGGSAQVNGSEQSIVSLEGEVKRDNLMLDIAWEETTWNFKGRAFGVMLE